MKVLECSSNGDIRFSAFGAKVEVFGKLDTIENHYQLSKRFISNTGEVMVPKTWKDAKGKKVDYFIVGNKEYEPKYLSAFYNLLWVKYLDNNLELVEYAKGFDDFSDMFKGKAVNCQADIIKKYIKEGRKSLDDFLEDIRKREEYEKSFMYIDSYDIIDLNRDIKNVRSVNVY